MLAVRIAYTDDDKSTERAAHLEAHKSYLRSTILNILQSGPIAGADGQIGALIVADVADLSLFKQFSDGDPFVKHGVYREIRICAWNVTIDNT